MFMFFEKERVVYGLNGDFFRSYGDFVWLLYRINMDFFLGFCELEISLSIGKFFFFSFVKVWLVRVELDSMELAV